jgi:uncharacterized protein (TIGR02118 family)
MVHLIFCLRRLPQLSRAQFQQYWRETHAPLVRKHAGTLGIKRYVQAHTIDPPGTQGIAAARGAPDPYDGVAEVWFDLNHLLSVAQRDAAVEAGRQLLEDEARFIDLAESPIFITEDHVIIGD